MQSSPIVMLASLMGSDLNPHCSTSKLPGDCQGKSIHNSHRVLISESCWWPPALLMCQALPLLTQGGPGCVGETPALRFLLHGFNKNPSVLQSVDFCPPFPHLHTGSRSFVCFVFYTLLLVTELVSNQGLDRVIPVYPEHEVFLPIVLLGVQGRIWWANIHFLSYWRQQRTPMNLPTVRPRAEAFDYWIFTRVHL